MRRHSPSHRVPSLWALAIVLIVAAGEAQAAAPIDPALTAQAAREGSVPVLVGLDAPSRERPESTAMALARRTAIGLTGQAVIQRLSATGLARLRSYPERPLLAVDATPADLAMLASAAEVVRVSRNRVHRPSLASTVPVIGADVTTAANYSGAGATIAVLDTGVNWIHPFLVGRIVEQACFSKNGSCPNGQTTQFGNGSAAACTYHAVCFHGTHVSGIAMGDNGSLRGVAPGSNLIAIQVFTEESGVPICGAPGSCAVAYDSDIIAGLDHVESLTGSYDIASVNMSFGSGAYSSSGQCNAQNGSVKAAVDDLVDLEIAVVAATGNDGSSSNISTPACLSTVISVSAVDDNDIPYSLGNTNSLLDLLAPGVSVLSSNSAGGFVIATGTSMATPHVAGAFAILHSADPSATRLNLLSALTSTGVSVLVNGITRPRIQVDDALASRAPSACFDGIDNDGDGDTDYPADPGCANGQSFEDPACDDDLDNDSDGTIDWDGGSGAGTADPNCGGPLGASELGALGGSCGIGPELLLLLPLLIAERRRLGRAGHRTREPAKASRRPTS